MEATVLKTTPELEESLINDNNISQENNLSAVTDKVLIFRLTLGVITKRKKVNVEQLQPGAKFDKKRVSASKSLWDCVELKEIDSVDARMRALCKLYSVGVWQGGGAYIIVNDSNETEKWPTLKKLYAAIMDEAKNRRTFIKILIDNYDKILLDCATELSDLFNRRDYPTKEQLLANPLRYFKFRVKIERLPTDTGIDAIDQLMAENNNAAKDAEWEELMITARSTVAQEMKEFVDDLQDRVINNSSRIRKEVVENVNEWLTIFERKKGLFENDAQINSLINDVKEVMAVNTAQDLRDLQKKVAEARSKGIDVRKEIQAAKEQGKESEFQKVEVFDNIANKVNTILEELEDDRAFNF
jgi:hypothetical protein